MLNPPSEFSISVSRISLFRRCPLAYQRRYLLKLPETVEPYMELGRAFHAYAAAKETGQPLPPAPLLPSGWLADWELLQRTYDAQTFDDAHLVGVEEPVALSWADGETKVRLRGVLDRLEIEGDRARVWDRKTGYRVPNADELRDDLQLTTYGILVCEKYPQIQVVECAQIQYRYSGRAVTVAFTREELDASRFRLVAEVGRMLRATEFPPGVNCTFCPPAAHASALQPYDKVALRFAEDQSFTVQVATPTTLEDAQRVAEGVKLAEQLATEGKRALARWSAERGPVKVGPTGAFGHWGAEKLECTDLEGYAQFCAMKGLLVRQYLRADTAGVRKILQRWPEASQYFTTVPGSKFGWRADAETAQRKTEEVKQKLEEAIYVGNEG